MRLDLRLRLAEARVRAREEKEGRGESDEGSLHIRLVVFGTFKSRWLGGLAATLYFISGSKIRAQLAVIAKIWLGNSRTSAESNENLSERYSTTIPSCFPAFLIPMSFLPSELESPASSAISLRPVWLAVREKLREVLRCKQAGSPGGRPRD
jgi:hypothetical protein